MTSLTDRYVHAVTRLLPASQRLEVDRELRILIDDLIAAQYDSAHPPADTGVDSTVSVADPAVSVEYAVLHKLGDPNLLAARYVESPRSLIGPELFPEYLRVLKIVLAIAVPSLVALSLLGLVVGGDVDAGSIFGTPIAAAYHAVVQTGFWVTLIYAFAHRWKNPAAWTPDDLPERIDFTGSDSTTTPTSSPSISDQVFGIIFTVLGAVLIVWQQVAPFVRENGVGIPILDPSIWNGPAQIILVSFGVSITIQSVAMFNNGWNYPLAIATLFNNLVSLSIISWLAFEGRVLNPDFLFVLAGRANWDQVPTVNPWIIVVIAAAIELWDVAEALLHAYKNPRTPIDA